MDPHPRWTWTHTSKGNLKNTLRLHQEHPHTLDYFHLLLEDSAFLFVLPYQAMFKSSFATFALCAWSAHGLPKSPFGTKSPPPLDLGEDEKLDTCLQEALATGSIPWGDDLPAQRCGTRERRLEGTNLFPSPAALNSFPLFTGSVYMCGSIDISPADGTPQQRTRLNVETTCTNGIELEATYWAMGDHATQATVHVRTDAGYEAVNIDTLPPCEAWNATDDPKAKTWVMATGSGTQPLISLPAGTETQVGYGIYANLGEGHRRAKTLKIVEGIFNTKFPSEPCSA